MYGGVDTRRSNVHNIPPHGDKNPRVGSALGLFLGEYQLLVVRGICCILNVASNRSFYPGITPDFGWGFCRY